MPQPIKNKRLLAQHAFLGPLSTLIGRNGESEMRASFQISISQAR